MAKPKGSPKTGGRKKGTRNKRTVAQMQMDASIDGDTPLAYLLAILRDERQPPERRMSAAVAAAPYMHSKLKQIEHSGLGGGPIEHEVKLNFGNEDAVRSIPIDWVDRGIKGALMNEESSVAVNGAKVMSE